MLHERKLCYFLFLLILLNCPLIWLCHKKMSNEPAHCMLDTVVIDNPNQYINCVVIGPMLRFLNQKYFKDIITLKCKPIKKSLVVLWSFHTQKMY